MSYVLGYFVADGCICVDKTRKNRPFTFNITSVDKEHLDKIKNVLGSEHKISKKPGMKGMFAYQIQFRNQILTKDLMNLGIMPRKTYNLSEVKVPDDYFADFVRGFFDGDGSVYIYNVNNTPQIKVGFVAASLSFITDFNEHLCRLLDITSKAIHKTLDKRRSQALYSTSLYISDCEKLYNFMYGNDPELYLERKLKVFDDWQNIKRRHYIKKDYPSKIGWHLNENLIRDGFPVYFPIYVTDI